MAGGKNSVESMTEQEITRAMTLLETEDLEKLAQVQVGKWAITNDNGIFGLYHKKREAIEDALCRHLQTRDQAKITRHGKGTYTLEILDCDEDPIERCYHSYSLERITESNLLWYKGLAICAMLPDWYFNPYSDRYQEFFKQDTERHD